MHKTTLFLISFLAGSAVLAHSGVQNPAVKARMDGMTRIAAELKVIGLMARGETLFAADQARAAAAAIADESARVSTLFADPEDDPQSEARAIIWDDYARFTQMAEDMQAVALNLSESIASQDDAVAALASLGQTCRACHTAFRE